MPIINFDEKETESEKIDLELMAIVPDEIQQEFENIREELREEAK